MLASTVAGAIICSILKALAHAHLEPPGAVLAGEEGVAGYPAGGGAVLGFLAGLAVATLRRRQAGLKALNAYPPIILMKQEGWQEDRQVLT